MEVFLCEIGLYVLKALSFESNNYTIRISTLGSPVSPGHRDSYRPLVPWPTIGTYRLSVFPSFYNVPTQSRIR